jgi:hypothetical protein
LCIPVHKSHHKARINRASKPALAEGPGARGARINRASKPALA